jgi:hypothetical protein
MVSSMLCCEEADWPTAMLATSLGTSARCRLAEWAVRRWKSSSRLSSCSEEKGAMCGWMDRKDEEVQREERRGAVTVVDSGRE